MFWSISKQTNLNQDQGKKELYKYCLVLINYKILSRYEYETGGRDTPFIFRRGYILLEEKNAALFCAKNSLFEMFIDIREYSIIRKLAGFFASKATTQISLFQPQKKYKGVPA